MTMAVKWRWSVSGCLGLGLMLTAWAVSWTHLRPWSEWSFFPLWLGYIIAVDALVHVRGAASPLRDRWWRVMRLFAVSAIVWWIFEAFNVRVQNWIYLDDEAVGPIQYVIQASLDFSTVLPAIFVTASLLGSFMSSAPTRLREPRRLGMNVTIGWEALGVITLVLPLIYPGIFFPLIWGCLFFLIDPLNASLGNRSLLADAAAGHWWTIVQLGAAGLVCGFFWEMWNSNAMPKWVYTIPHIPETRLFEMPLLGYAGYIPFAFECFAIYVLVLGIFHDTQGSLPTNLAP